MKSLNKQTAGLTIGLVWVALLSLAWSLPLWFVVQSMGLRVSPLSLDLVLLWLGMLFLSCKRVTALMALVFLPVLLVLDFVAYGPTGGSLPGAYAEGLQSLGTLPWQARSMLIGLLALGLVMTVMGGFTLAQWRPGAFLVLALCAVVLTWSGRLVPPEWKQFRSGLFESGKMLIQEPQLFQIRTGLKASEAHWLSGYSRAQQLLPVDDPTVMIVVESLGVPVDGEQAFIKKWATQFSEARTCLAGGDDAVQAGVRDSTYFTIEAEFRELCSMRITGFYPAFDEAACMPAKWANAVAYHNNTWAFYGRKSLYRKMGFKSVWARENLQLPVDQGLPFGGIPDALLAERIIENAGTQAGLHYWMTLDLHSPYDARPDIQAIDSRGVYETLLDKQLLLFQRMMKALPRHRFFLVGDHTPKFFDATDGQFQVRRVPYFLVQPCP